VSPIDPPQRLLVGLIGAGIQQSLSPRVQEREAQHHGLQLHYQLIDFDLSDASVADLATLLRAGRIIGFAGFNVTYPCKQAIVPLLDAISDEANAMGAVNTVVFRGGKSIGHNTDGPGWAWGFRRQLPNADMRRVVLLGCGGAGSAIAHASLGLGVRELVLVDDERHQALALAASLAKRSPRAHIVVEDQCAEAMRGATGLIHATPIGMHKSPGVPLDVSLLHPSMWVSEVVYVPLETQLLSAARKIGCAVMDGGHMNVGQAIDAFKLFTGLDADAERVQAYFRSVVQ
jgi:shikimate dehydrogenase